MNILDREFEKFIGGPTQAYCDRVHVTIGPNGSLFLNRKAHLLMGKPVFVYLYYSRAKDTIVIEPTQTSLSSVAFKMQEDGGTSGGRRIYANPFCKHFRIKPQETLRFVSPSVDAVGRMFLKLTETVVVAAAPRKRKAK
ncbi:MAG: hypothetical protein KF756_04580 [Acidobacteria bacterium]|nr:hypothetical protein [Acidobacteriota bacterium]